MSEVLRPCLDCGELSPNSRCEQHTREHRAGREREQYSRKGRRTRASGHDDAAFRRLGRAAKRQQPWCLDCGRTAEQVRESGDRLEADHLPSAWHKREHKKTILLSDIEVVCGPCNIARGSSRPGSKRWNEWLENENPENRESNDNGTTSTQK